MRSLVVTALCGLVLASCGSDRIEQRTVTVPGDYGTIADAVADATEGTTIEVGPGVYHESIVVETKNVTLRGADRNEVILDGRHALANGISVVADDVAIENLTVRNYLQNGVLFNGVEAAEQGDGANLEVDYGIGDDVLVGYRVSYVTTHNNGLYGVYAFAARDGLIEHSYASGHPDSGFYVGQCRPCNVVLSNLVAEQNAIGYYGTNASGGVIIASSVFRNNRLGIAPNSQRMERLAPQAEAIVVGNLVEDNDDPSAPRIPSGYFGGGIAIGGGTKNMILRNRVSGHDRAGIEILDLDTFLPVDNRIEGNVLSANTIDLVYAVRGASGGGNNCFSSNTFSSSVPAEIERLLPCDASPMTFVIPALLTLVNPPQVDYRAVEPPGAQPNMPSRRPIVGAGPVPRVDVDAIGVP